jgi:hypothetical protein
MGRTLAGCLLALVALLVVPGSAGASWRDAPVLPEIDSATSARIAQTLAYGRSVGNRANVLLKVGDSISESPSFLQGIGCGRYDLAGHTDLLDTIRYFSARRLHGFSDVCPNRVNSLSRHDASTLTSQLSDFPLMPGAAGIRQHCRSRETALACDFRRIKPGYAVILLGTNDARSIFTPQEVAGNLKRIIAALRRNGTQPILNTVPPRPGWEAEVESINQALVPMANRRHVPIINLWRAFEPLPNQGLAVDNIHPSLFGAPDCDGYCDPRPCAPRCQPANFTAQGLQFGHDLRNYLTLRTLAEVRAIQPAPAAR